MGNTSSDIKQQIHQLILNSLPELSVWFDKKSEGVAFPFYSSFDIRDSSYKIATVDANIFPAGFNLICNEDQSHSVNLIQKFLTKHYPNVKKVLLLAEEHTHNLYYWDNIHRIKVLIESAGFKVSVCVPGKNMPAQKNWETASGYSFPVSILEKEEGDLIISNNDFSSDHDILINKPLTPALNLGWHIRKKHDFFNYYNEVATEFANLIEIDPWHFTVETRLFSPFDVTREENREELKAEVSKFLDKLKENQAKHTNKKPYLFLKNNSGTYGLGVVSLNCPDEVDHWNYKIKKTLKASKGGRGIKELILQEGIPTSVLDHDYAAEPTLYMIGSELSGGFLRTHKSKSAKENLNSPGAAFKKLCVRDLQIELEGHVMENVYGWIARLGFLALLQEIKKGKLDFRGYKV